jgi:hypothetical protein
MKERKQNVKVKKNDKNILMSDGISNSDNLDEKITVETKEESISLDTKLVDKSLQDLVFLEKACFLICKKYEISAKINNDDLGKFKRFQSYYELISSAIEEKIINLFDNQKYA